jgi:hypothetical protein
MEPTTTTGVEDFRYINLRDVDPNFTLLDGPEFYNLRITKAEFASYTAKKETKSQQVGDQVTYTKLTFVVVGHPKFTGRKIWSRIFPGDFGYKVMRRIADATGIEPTDVENFVGQLNSITPVVKLSVVQVPDNFHLKPDGTPGLQNEVDWKSGVQPADVQ